MGTENIMVNGYSFTKSYVYKSTDIAWRCTNRRGNCPAILRTDAHCTAVIGGTSTHSHEPYSDRDIDRKLLRNSVKRKAAESDEAAVRPSKLVHAQLETLNEHSLERRDLRLVVKAVYRHKLRHKLKTRKTRRRPLPTPPPESPDVGDT